MAEGPRQGRRLGFGWNTYGLGGGRQLDDDVEDIEDKSPDVIVKEARR